MESAGGVNMKTRIEAIEYFNKMTTRGKRAVPDIAMRNYRGLPYHWGLCEFRELLDFIYDGEPTNEREYLIDK